MAARLFQPTRERLKQLGRKGGRATQRHLQAVEAMGPPGLLDVLNKPVHWALRGLADEIIAHVLARDEAIFFETLKTEPPPAAQTDPHDRQKVQRLPLFMRADALKWIRRNKAAKQAFRSRPRGEAWGSRSPEARAWLIATVRRVSPREIGHMVDLWAADAHWLERLRKCEYFKCRHPYFIDVGSSARGVYCRDSHRADAHKPRWTPQIRP